MAEGLSNEFAELGVAIRGAVGDFKEAMDEFDDAIDQARKTAEAAGAEINSALSFSKAESSVKALEEQIESLGNEIMELKGQIEAVDGSTINVDTDLDEDALAAASLEESSVEADGDVDVDDSEVQDAQQETEKLGAKVKTVDDLEIDIDVDFERADIQRFFQRDDLGFDDLDIEGLEPRVGEVSSDVQNLDVLEDEDEEVDVDDSDVQDAQDEAEELLFKLNRIDDFEIDIDVDFEESGTERFFAQEVQEGLAGQDVEAVEPREGRFFRTDVRTIDVNTEPAQREIDALTPRLTSARQKLRALDGTNVDVDVNLDRDSFARVVDSSDTGGSLSGGGGGRGGRFGSSNLASDFSRLSDELFASINIFRKVPPQVQAFLTLLATAVVSFGTLIASVGGLAAAATGLATKLGDTGVKQALQQFKVRITNLGRTFVDQMRPVVMNQVIPAAQDLSSEIRALIPELSHLTRNNLDELTSVIPGMAEGVVDFVQTMESVVDAFDLLRDTIKIVSNVGIADQSRLDQLGARALESARDFFGEDDFATVMRMAFPSRMAGALMSEDGPTIGEAISNVVSISPFDNRQVGGAPPFDPSEQSPRDLAQPFGDLDMKAQKEMNKIQDEIANVRERFENDMIPKEELLKQLASLRMEGVKVLQKYQDRVGRIPPKLQDWIDKQITIANRADKVADREPAPEVDFVELPDDEEERDFAPGGGDGFTVPDMFEKPPVLRPETPRFEIFGRALRQLQKVKKDMRAGLVKPIDAAEREVQLIVKAMKQLNKEGAQGSRVYAILESRLGQAKENLKAMKNEAEKTVGLIKRAAKEAQNIGTKAKQAFVGFVDNISGGIGDAIGGALFKDQERMQQLKGRRRDIQRTLRSEQRADNPDVQRLRQLRKELKRVNKKIKQGDSLMGRLSAAFRSFGRSAKQALQQLISEIIKAIVKMLAMKAVMAVLNIASGGGGSVAQGIGTGVTAGMSMQSAASGGFVDEGGLAKIHKGETIVPADQVSRSGSSSAVPMEGGGAAVKGNKIEIPVEVVDTAVNLGSTNKSRAARQ